MKKIRNWFFGWIAERFESSEARIEALERQNSNLTAALNEQKTLTLDLVTELNNLRNSLQQAPVPPSNGAVRVAKNWREFATAAANARALPGAPQPIPIERTVQ